MEGNHKEENEGQVPPKWAETILDEIPDKVIERYDIEYDEQNDKIRLDKEHTCIFIKDKETTVRKTDTIVELLHDAGRVTLWQNVDEIIVSMQRR